MNYGIILFIICVNWIQCISAFQGTSSNNNRNQLNTFATNHRQFSTSNSLTKLHSTRPSKEGGVTSTLISNLAVIALKLRLSSQTSVQCKVESSSRDILLKQSIGPVSVRGRDWSSPLGLTCKAIQADVDTCMLDMNSVVTKRKLILLEPAKGVAMIAFNDSDFGNFLIHPLLLQQAPMVSKNDKFEFVKDDVQIVKSGEKEEECVIFYGNCRGQRWKCYLKRGLENPNSVGKGGGRLADIKVIYQNQLDENSTNEKLDDGEIESLEAELTMIVTNFFNELVFELDGTFLSYKDLKFHTPKKASGNSDLSETNIMFALDITVRKFPSPGLAF